VPSPSRYLTLEEAAGRLGVHPNTVQSWLKRGYLLTLEPSHVDGLRRRLDADWDDMGKRIV